ncbi:MAG: carboxypeptidase regulatory-like domain-containing protein [Ahniella sp.]|nr:carboxypeptidase regulatory-like domain-containing protein [Ahniella sp.]
MVLTMVSMLLIVCAGISAAQVGAPPAGAACVVSAGNRNAPLAADGSYTVFGIPGNLGAIRARATCSDGSVGQSGIGFTNPFQPDTINLGPIVFGQIDPVPVAVTLSAPNRYLTTGQTSQLTATAVGINGASYDVTPRSQGTVYSISNDLLATGSENGEVRIYPQFAEGSSSRVVVSSISEGGVASTLMYVLGPRGTLTGTVIASDGVTPVAGAEVSVLRLQPMEQAGTAITNAQGQFRLEGVSAGNFVVSAIEPSTLDRAVGYSRIGVEGETANINLRLNGLGTVAVTVLDALDQPVPATEVTFTALGNFRDVRALNTGANGIAGFANVAAGDFTVSAREPVTRLIGTAVARVAAGEVLPVTLKLQPIGEIRGRVFDVDGTTVRAGVQVRIISRQRGILTQMLSAADGSFAFDTLPLSDGPYTLDAFVDGRLRARLPGAVISVPNEVVTRNIVLAPSGTVRGEVRRGGSVVPDSVVRLQSLEGLRLSFEQRADAQGRFRFPAVPVGDFELLATAPNGQNARALGRVSADGAEIALDVIIADDTLAGTVFQRDGVTPVGSGVTVYLAPKSLGNRYTYASVGQGVLSTETDAQGRFGFVVAQTGTYFVQAEDGLERGRSETVVVNLNPAQPLDARVVFLAKGTVRGRVRNVAGAAQGDVPVTVRSEGAFTLDRTTRTAADGSYQIDGVFIGDLTGSARNEVTQLSGISYGRLNAEAEQVDLDITLAATATITGQVVKRLGGAATGPVRLTVRRDGGVVQVREFPTAAYQFDLVPIGRIEVEAEELGTGDRGIATTRVAGAGDNKVLDVRLVGQGQVNVQALDEFGQPVVGARITVRTGLPFHDSQEKLSDANGRASFDEVFAGDFSVSASKSLVLGTLSGSAQGTLLPGAVQSITVTMQTLVIGSVEGQLLQPDGVTPAPAGWVIRMLPEPFLDAFVTTTDSDGRYRFAEVPAGSYTIDALRFYDRLSCPQRDRVRARATGVQVDTQGETTEADLTLIGQGIVSGRVTAPSGGPVAGVRITLTNPDPVYGANVTCTGLTTYVRTTDGNGEYTFDDAPPGDFTIAASTANGGQAAEGVGRVRFDGDVAIVDLELIDSAITLPRTLHDANGFRFDVLGNGSIGTGTNTVFAGSGPDNAGMRLEIVRNGVAVPFVNGNGSIGRLGRNGQQIDVDDSTASGLMVRREVYVPRAGYFARYLEVLENPGTEAITVDVLVKSHHRAAQSNPRVVDTSDGDQVLNVIGLARDRWVVVDDQIDADPFVGGSSIPATAHVFDGADGASVQVASASYELIGQTGRLNYRWNAITVPAGGRVALMHFVLNQIDRFSARAAALRVSTLPPEMLDDLTTEERRAVLNFVLPDTSVIEPLPNLDAGQLQGRVFSGDGVTPVPGAEVRFKSKHPLFGRVRYDTTDAQGGFEFRSTLDGTINNYVIPVFGFDLSARYVRSLAITALTPGDFAPETTSVEQDLVFVGQGDVRGVVRRHNQSSVADADVILCRLPNRNSCSNVAPNPSNRDESAADGSYLMVANPPRDYFLFAQKPHPQNPRTHGARPIFGAGTVSITAGDTAVADVMMEETGSIAGQILSADGTPLVDAYVDIAPLPGFQSAIRGTRTDTFGRYRLVDVPLGNFQVRAEDESSNAQGNGQATVVVDGESIVDITLRPFGLLRVQVNYARGIAAGNASVSVAPFASGLADTNGRINLQAPEGTHIVRATHPDSLHAELAGTTTAVIATPGQQVDVLVTLGSAGQVFGTIVRPDGTTLAEGFPYTVRRLSGGSSESRSAHTSNTGAFRQNGLPLGQYLLTAYDAAQDRYIDAEFALASDGEEVELNLVLLENRIALPADLLDANRFRFDVQRNGSLAQGSGSFNAGAARLSVNGIAYTGETSARLEATRRQFLIAQPTSIGGLNVSRRIHVPRGAYYARYLEIFENPSAEARTVDVALSHRLATGAVVSSSSGDITADGSDHWVAFDDAINEDILLRANQAAPTAFLFSTDSAALRPDSVTVQPDSGLPALRTRWSALTVPAGGRVVLMHFVVQQIHRDGLQAAVGRLMQLPPEALADLGTEDRLAIRNLVLPPTGTESVPALPSLTASVSGITFEGDARTPVRSARVTVQSAHPLFNRIWGMMPDSFPNCPQGTALASLRTISTIPPNTQNPPPLGQFVLAGQLTANDSIAIPEGVPVRITAQESRACFTGSAGHPWTGVPSRVETVNATAERDLIFDTGVLTGTATGSADFSVTNGRMYLSIDDPDPYANRYIPIAADGTWTYPGLLPGTYDVLFDVRHTDATGQDILRGQRPASQVDLGQITVTDVNLQPTGRIQGAVVSFTGEQSVAARVLLSGLAADQTYDQCASGCVPETLAKHRGKKLVSREVLTDSLGRYSFSAVPVGHYTLTVIDPISDGRTSRELDVAANETALQNVTLLPLGRAELTVLNAAGQPVVDAYVYLYADAQGFEKIVGRTDFFGRLTVANIAAGNYRLRIRDPRFPNAGYLERTVTGTITGQGQVDPHSVSLLAVANLAIRVIHGAVGSPGIAGADVRLIDSRGTQYLADTNAQGDTTASVVPQGVLTVRANAQVAGIDREGDVQVTIGVAQDNQTVPVTVNLADALVPLPKTLFDANRSEYPVTSAGAGVDMPRLSVSGTVFTGTNQAVQQLAQRQFSITQPTPIAGLRVSRKVFVPRNGYFARYLEVLENEGTAPVSVNVQISTEWAWDEFVHQTSSGDDTIGDDHWVTWTRWGDDYASTQGALYADAGIRAPNLALVDDEGTPRLQATWSNVTVAAGERRVFMHFLALQHGRAAARESMQRLLQLPPEAMDGLLAESPATIASFAVPVNGQSVLPSLPSLLGQLSGRVLEGDGSAVANANVRVRSQHPLFVREWSRSEITGLASDATGAYRIDGVLRDDSQSVPMPIDTAVDVRVTHPQTSVLATAIGPFAGDGTQVLDVRFSGGVLTGRILGAFQHSPMSGTVIVQGQGNTSIAPDGQYRMGGLEAGTWQVSGLVDLSDGTDLTFQGATATITDGQAQVLDITLPPNGAVRGVVRTAAGTPLANASVRFQIAGAQRQHNTNAQGEYFFNAALAGNANLRITDPRSQAITNVPVTIVANQETVRDIDLPAIGTVNVLVRYARGTPASNTQLRVSAPTLPSQLYLGYTDAQGRLSATLPVGSLTFEATHPQSGETIQATTALDNDGQVLEYTLDLPPSARVQTTVRSGGVGLPGVRVQMRRATGSTSSIANGLTNTTGQFTSGHLSSGSYLVTAVSDAGATMGQVSVSAPNDGQTVMLELALDAMAASSGVLSFDGERHVHAVTLTAGDELSLHAMGATVGVSPALCAVRVAVYDPSQVRVAEGVGLGPDQYTQTNSFGDLRRIQAASSGRYFILVRREYSGCTIGGYRLVATRQGEPVAIGRDLGGSRIEGRVLAADATTPVPNAIVRLRNYGNVGVHEQVRTDALGQFVYPSVRVGSFDLSHWSASGSESLVSVTGNVQQAGDVITRDLILPATTTVNVTVRADGNVLPGAQVLLYSNSTYVNRTTDASGQLSYVYRGNGVLTVRATHPTQYTVSAEATVTPADGQVRAVDLDLSFGAVEGFVRDSAGAVKTGAYVEAQTLGGSSLVSVYSGADGRYRFNALPSIAPVRIMATDPQNSVVVSEDVTVTTGGTVQRDLQLPAHGTVALRVVNQSGTPIPYVTSFATFETRIGSGSVTTHDYGQTDNQGERQIVALPVGRAITVVAEYYGTAVGDRSDGAKGAGGGYVRAEAQITLDTPGQNLPLTIEIDVPVPSVVRAELVRADGVAMEGYCYFYLEPGNLDGAYGEGPCNEALTIEDVPAGQHQTRFVADGYSVGETTITVEEEGDTEFTHVVSVVRGEVRHPDGEVIADAYVSLTDSLAEQRYVYAGATGRFTLLGAAPGAFSLRAEDPASSLSAELAGSLSDANVPLDFDVVMPNSGTVRGTIRDAGGQPVALAEVNILSMPADLSRSTTADANGTYTFARVPLGAVDVAGVKPGTALKGGASGALATHGEIQTLDVTLPVSGSINGLLQDSGNKGMPGLCIDLRSQQTSFGHDYLSLRTTTDALGAYRFDEVAPGSWSVTAQACSNPDEGAIAHGDVTSSQATVIPLVWGTGITVPRQYLDPPSGLTHYIGGDGNYAAWRMPDYRNYAFASGPYFELRQGTLPTMYFPYRAIAGQADAGRTLELGPARHGDLLIRRQIHVPVAGGFVRVLESITNLGTVPRTPTLAIRGVHGSDALLTPAPPILPERFAVQSANGSNPYYAPAVAGYVYGGTGGPVQAAADFVSGRAAFSYQWAPTVAPGQTIGLLHYWLVGDPADPAQVVLRAQSLSNQAEAGMFDGLSPSQRAQIINFQVPVR